MGGNFTLADIVRSLEAAFLLPLFLVVPGYVLGGLLDLLRFRRQPILIRLLLSTLISIAVCPILTFLVGSFLGFGGIWAMYAITWAAFLVMVSRERGRIAFKGLSRLEWAGAGAVALWTGVALAAIVDLQLGSDQLYLSTSAFDYSLRVALTGAVTRGMPPINPLFAIAAPPLRYHYFWMLMCSLPAKLAHIAPRQAMYGGTVWVGIALMSLIAVAVKFFLRESEALGRKALLGIGLLAVTGLDLLPLLSDYLRFHVIRADTEWWNSAQITSWIGSLVWVPHHVAAMIACMVALLVLFEAAESESRSRQVIAAVVAGAAFASSVGLSVFVTLTFVVFCALWVLLNIVRRRFKDVMLVMGAGAVSAVLAWPHLNALTGGGGGSEVAGAVGKTPAAANFVQVAVRTFLPVDVTLAQLGVRDPRVYHLADFLALPLGYVLELGFFFAIGWLRWRAVKTKKQTLSREEMAGWTLIASSLLIGSFLKSTTIQTNDLGWRCFLPTQFVLLLWAVPVLHGWLFGNAETAKPGRSTRWLLATTLALGIGASAYQLAMLRFYPVMADRGLVPRGGWLAPDQQDGRRTYALRLAYEQLQYQVPDSAIVQHNPSVQDYLPYQLYANRGAAAGAVGCGTTFGGDERRCQPVYNALLRLFNAPQVLDGEYVDRFCTTVGIDSIVVTDTDPVWQDRRTWVWSRQPSLANEFVRVFRCGTKLPQSKRSSL